MLDPRKSTFKVQRCVNMITVGTDYGNTTTCWYTIFAPAKMAILITNVCSDWPSFTTFQSDEHSITGDFATRASASQRLVNLFIRTLLPRLLPSLATPSTQMSSDLAVANTQYFWWTPRRRKKTRILSTPQFFFHFWYWSEECIWQRCQQTTSLICMSWKWGT